MRTLTAELTSRAYPGRLCLIARMPSGAIRFVYALTGRSQASQARALHVQADAIEVVDTRTATPRDDLRHYVAAVHLGRWTVIGNGDHVGPLTEALRSSSADSQAALETAWNAHTYEPDPPIFTPRIWAAAHEHRSGELSLWAGSVTRSITGSPTHRVWGVDGLAPGSAAIVTTYWGSREKPRPCHDLATATIDSQEDTLIDEVWAALDPSMRITAIELDPTVGDFHGALLRSAHSPRAPEL